MFLFSRPTSQQWPCITCILPTSTKSLPCPRCCIPKNSLLPNLSLHLAPLTSTPPPSWQPKGIPPHHAGPSQDTQTMPVFSSGCSFIHRPTSILLKAGRHPEGLLSSENSGWCCFQIILSLNIAPAFLSSWPLAPTELRDSVLPGPHKPSKGDTCF